MPNIQNEVTQPLARPTGPTKMVVGRPRRRPALHEIPPNAALPAKGGKQIIAATTAMEKVTEPLHSTKQPETVVEKTEAKPQQTDDTISFSSLRLENIVDVDADDNNLFMVSEYIKDIYNYLIYLENKYVIENNFLRGHKTTMRMRHVLMNWIIEVCQDFGFLSETLQLAMTIIDRYLQKNKQVGRDNLQLVGVAALMVAAKYEEIYVPGSSDFVYVGDESFTYKELFSTEIKILRTLAFNLGRPLPIHFLRRFSKIVSSTSEQHNLAKYFLDICLFDYSLCAYKPSMQAAASCFLALCVLDDQVKPDKVWNQTYQYYTTYIYEELKPVVIKLTEAFTKLTTSNYLGIRKKYSVDKLDNVSNHPQLKTSKALQYFKSASANIATRYV